ncbi:transcription intermediary factor 1-beta, partial [Tautogolabrus adspersus]
METSAGPGNTFSMQSPSPPQCCSCDSSSSCCWCVDCNEALCGSCLLAHRRVKITRSHQILNEPPAGAVKTPPTKYCKLHPSEPLKLFCFTCHQLTCRDCQLINHMNHRYQFVSEALDKLKKQMDYLLQPFRAQSDTVRRSLQDMETRLQDIAESEVQLQTELHHAHRVLIQHMKNRTMEILKKVKEMSEHESEQIRVRMMNLKQLQEQRQTLTERAEAAKNASDLTQLLYFAAQVQALTRKVSDQDLSPPQNMVHLKVITDKPALDAILNFATSTVPVPAQTVGDIRTNRQQLIPKSQTQPDKTSSYVPSCSDISPCSSVKPHQPGLVVKAMADSACDSSVQQVTLRHQEPAENEPTSTVSEEPEPSEKPSTPEVLDSDTEEPSSEIGGQDFKLSLWQPRVSLDRLPLALSHPGSPLPSFRLVPGDAEDEFYLEELSEDSESHDDDITDDHSKPQWHDDEVSDCYKEPLSSPDSPLTLQTVGCSVCQSPNGSIICSACGRGYHRDCHVPPVGCDIWMEWTCSLCQDLTDPSDPYSSD